MAPVPRLSEAPRMRLVPPQEVLRIGLQETADFITHFYPNQTIPVLESCGVADLVRCRESEAGYCLRCFRAS